MSPSAKGAIERKMRKMAAMLGECTHGRTDDRALRIGDLEAFIVDGPATFAPSPASIRMWMADEDAG